jgi:O-antigen ligase
MAVVERPPEPAPAAAEPARAAAPTGTTFAGTALLLLLAGLALLDRPFGVLGMPGVPVYVTEIVLALCVLELLVRRNPLAGISRGRWLAPLMIAVFLGWGAIRLLTSFGNPILDVLRDSALVYYALFALVAYALGGLDRRFTPAGLLELYGRFVPVLLVVAPTRLIFATVPSLQAAGPVIPGSDVPLLGGHRPGNLGVQVALAVVYLATNGRRDRWTVAGIVAGLLTILLAATQNRGGFLSACLVIGVAVLLWGRRARFRWLATASVLACMLVVAWGLNLSIQSGQRDISANQLLENVESLARDDPAGSSQLADTEDFRSQLWTLVLDETVRTNQLENGWGFGPNLGASFLPTHEDQALRNPHNSHLTILARLGIVGLGIWVVMLLSWFRRVLGVALEGRRARHRPTDRARLAMLCSAVTAGMLLNAFFDPTFETPMAAVWLWSVLGIGIGLVVRPTAAETPDPGTTPTR